MIYSVEDEAKTAAEELVAQRPLYQTPYQDPTVKTSDRLCSTFQNENAGSLFDVVRNLSLHTSHRRPSSKKNPPPP